jgi:uncharacterized membrane protein (UPF0127 family)
MSSDAERRRPLHPAIVQLFALLLSVWMASGARAEPAFERLEIVTASGSHAFETEVARTMEERATGLMFRRELAENRAMLFDFGVEQKVMMWMKNTYIPLDMIFVGKNGRVVSIAHDAKPMSEDLIPSGGPTYAVIELAGGVAKKIGVAVGDRVRHSIFRN